MRHNEPSFLFSYWISDRPDGHQVVGLETEHFCNLLMRVEHTVFRVNLFGDVFHRELMSAGDCLDRIAPIRLSKTLEIEDFPFEDSTNVGVP
jgi:hypothetical protein